MPMPIDSDRFLHRFSGLDGDIPNDPAVVARFTAVGFQEEDFKTVRIGVLAHDLHYYDAPDIDLSLKLLSESASSSEQRGFILRNLTRFENGSELLRAVSKVLTASKERHAVLDEAKVVVQKNIEIFMDGSSNMASRTNFIGSVARCFKVMLSKRLYPLAGNDPARLVGGIRGIFENRRNSSDYLDATLDFVEENKFGGVIVDGLDLSILPRLFNHTDTDFVKSKKRAELINRSLKASGSWPGRIKMFLEYLGGERFLVVSQDLYERALLADWAKKSSKEDGRKGVGPQQYIDALGELSSEDRFRHIWLLTEEDIETGGKAREKAIKSIEKLRNKDLAVVAGISPEDLIRIGRRENPLHPLNTLGVARRVGHEVEYTPGDTDKQIRRKYGFEILDIIGFFSGGGGGEAVETSPGPFYDPLTAVTVFNLFADSGIIDLHRRNSQTMHFNVDMLPTPSLELRRLVRALHASGYSNNPNIAWERPELYISPNGDHTEGKVFDVVSKKGFGWTMESASFLCWTIAARERLKNRVRFPNTIDGRLASIWQSYIHILTMGFESVGVNGYLENANNRSIEVRGVIDQLKIIFPDKDIPALHRDVSKADESLLPGVKPVVLSQTDKYANIAHFVRVVTDLHVAKVRALADDLEMKARKEVVSIDKLPRWQKAKAVDRFLKKYKTPVKSNETNEEVYARVRSIFAL